MSETTTEKTASGSPLKVHHLRPAPGAKKAKTRVGRGEGSKGKTAGRGTKGTGARGNTSARFEGGQTPLHMRLPKLSGFKNNNKVVFQVVNLDRIAALGVAPKLRTTIQGKPFRTDGGNYIADCGIADGVDAAALEQRLAGIVGVVEVGGEV